ncbi:MAG: hypothetical protein K2N58_02315 [Treponemataceae bacterium]|nr:hypothetical protein [Treponemataceae bacterium]
MGGVLATLFLAILICFASCKNSSSSGDDYKDDGNQGKEIPKDSYSFGGDLSEDLKVAETDSSGNKNFSVEENVDGIQIKFAIPNKNVVRYEVFIEGIGQVSETGVGENKTDDFFYPFLAPGKEYTVRIKFLKNENQDDEGFSIVTPDQTLGYIDVKAKAGANSKGEVKISNFGIIEVKNNGDFKFTKKPAFRNENLLTGNGYDWNLGIGLNYGISWLHEDRRSKWLTEIQIPNKELLGKTYNFYTYPRPYGDVTKVDFIVWRPKMSYKYDDKVYFYQWDGNTLETNCQPDTDLWTSIDITKSEDVAKIKGTWTRIERDVSDYKDKYHLIETEMLIIDSTNIKHGMSWTFTKLDGSAFTNDELSHLVYEDDDYTLSNDGKTVTNKEESKPESLSEYFEDYSSESNSYTEHYDLKLFEDGKTLEIIQSGKHNDGTNYKEHTDYTKQ